MDFNDLEDIIIDRDKCIVKFYVKGRTECVNMYPSEEWEFYHFRKGISSHTLTINKEDYNVYINIEDISSVTLRKVE